MSEVSARVGVGNRRILAGFWTLFGVVCLVLTLTGRIQEANLSAYAVAVGVCFLISAVGFFKGWKWGRVAIGVLVAPLSLLCFNWLLGMHFQRYYGFYFWLCLVLLVVGFYTWVFLFTGLDRDALRTRYRNGDEPS